LGEEGGFVTLSGKSITQNPNGTLRWTVPSEARFEVSVPYQGELPRLVILHLLSMTSTGEVEIGSISSRPTIDGDSLKYSVALPAYGVVQGRQKCKIRTTNPTGEKLTTIHEGDLEIEFVKSENPG
jgi:hypothetical protein